MTSRKARPKSITEYINAAPKEAQKKLREMRECICAAAPWARGKLEVGDARFLPSKDTSRYCSSVLTLSSLESRAACVSR